MTKTIIYQENGRKERAFTVKGRRNSQGLIIEKEPDEIVEFVKSVDYLGGFYSAE